MIQPVPWPGAAFTLAADGDQKDRANRRQVSDRLGITGQWATVKQVHSARVVEVTDHRAPLVEADGLFTTTPGLPVAILTADCAAVILGGAGGVGAAHAGWRGMAGGVVANLRRRMRSAGIDLAWAALGPFIGPCCFEVGPEVAEQFSNHTARSRQGLTSVDLGEAAREQLDDLPIWWSNRCTRHHRGHYSYRGGHTTERMAALGWVCG